MMTEHISPPPALPRQDEDNQYTPNEQPAPSRFEFKCYPQATEICAEIDKFFLEHWPFKGEEEKRQYIGSQVCYWACLSFPLASDDRIVDTCKVNTLLFLLDDVVENMDLDEGRSFYSKLVRIAMGKAQPDRAVAYEWITYDVFASMRASDEELTNEVLKQAMVCLTAQVSQDRNQCSDMGALLGQRVKEGGCAFVAALMRFSMHLDISTEMLKSLEAIHKSYGNLGIIVNDIYSFDKELRAWEMDRKEASNVLNLVKYMAVDAGLSYSASKRVLWTLCREWEMKHQELVAEYVSANGCDNVMRTYLKGLEYVLGGNEQWSMTTGRYHMRD